jgi:hypothetical protein
MDKIEICKQQPQVPGSYSTLRERNVRVDYPDDANKRLKIPRNSPKEQGRG